MLSKASKNKSTSKFFHKQQYDWWYLRHLTWLTMCKNSNFVLGRKVRRTKIAEFPHSTIKSNNYPPKILVHESIRLLNLELFKNIQFMVIDDGLSAKIIAMPVRVVIWKWGAHDQAVYAYTGTWAAYKRSFDSSIPSTLQYHRLYHISWRFQNINFLSSSIAC